MGMAASFIVLLAGIGAYASFSRIAEGSQPQEIRLDKAYRLAIHEFESVALSEGTISTEAGKSELAAARKSELQSLNKAIDQFRGEIGSRDLSPMKRLRLRELYGLKLKVLQEMILQGDIEL